MNKWNVHPKPFRSFREALDWRHTDGGSHAFSCHYWHWGVLTQLQFFERDSRWLWSSGPK